MSGSEGQVKPFLFSYPGPGFLAAMGGAIIRDQIQFLVRIGGQQSAQETDEGGTVGSARICPLWTSKAASSEAVPFRLYSWLSLSIRCGLRGKRGWVRSKA